MIILEKERNILIWIFIAVIVAIVVLGSFGMGGYGMMGLGMGFGFVFMLIFWGLIIWIIVTLVNSAQSNKKEDSDPLTILKKRFAKGEMTKKQYEEMRKELLK